MIDPDPVPVVPEQREDRRATARVILDRLSAGKPLTSYEATLLRALFDTECAIADHLAGRLNARHHPTI